jgi:hypothetical protein
MSSYDSPPARRFAPLAAALLLAAASAVFAAEPPPPPPPVEVPPLAHDTTALGFIQHVVIGTPPPGCPDCPPRVCAEQPYPVTISGVLPSPCIAFRGFRELPVAAPFTVLAAEFKADTCSGLCLDVEVPFSATLTLPPSVAGANSFHLFHSTRGCPDSSLAESLVRIYTYTVEPPCDEPPPEPPPLDSLAKTLVRFAVTPERRCPGDSLTVEMIKNGCPSCVDLVSLGYGPTPAVLHPGFHWLTASVEWRTPCVELVCQPETLRVRLRPLVAGANRIGIGVRVNVLRAPQPDTSTWFVRNFEFEVPPTCDSTGCVHPWLLADANTRGCALEVMPGKKSSLTLHATSPVDLGGLQGRIECPPPFRVAGVRPPPGQPRFHVSWTAEGRGARYVLFTSGGDVIRTGRSRVLELEIEADATASIGERGALVAPVELAAGPGGEDVPLCDITLFRLPSIPLCVASPADSCDANGDGRADVRDLVRMTRCLSTVSPPVDSAGVCRDCSGDGVFTFADLWCCARHILRGPFAPRDSVRSDDALRVSLEPVARFGEGWMMKVRLTGAGGVAGTMLRLRYPGERWRADVPVFVDGPQALPASHGWVPILDHEEPGVVQVGGFRLEDEAASEVEFLLAFTPTGTPEASDRLVAEGADMVAGDGSILTPSAPLPSVSLFSPEQPPVVPSEVALGPARPNPFTRSTRFTVQLPREAHVDLAVHDLAGRRLATLASGRLPAGPREFTWDGAGARNGLYFVRLVVDGRVYSSRVALLRDGR